MLSEGDLLCMCALVQLGRRFATCPRLLLVIIFMKRGEGQVAHHIQRVARAKEGQSRVRLRLEKKIAHSTKCEVLKTDQPEIVIFFPTDTKILK